MNQPSHNPRPSGVTVIVAVNGFAFIITAIFWGFVFFRKLVPLPGDLAVLSERANAAVTYGFMLGDIVWSLPLLFLGTWSLWRMQPLGWTATLMANALWIYSLTVILTRDLSSTLSPGSILFLPFALFSFWTTYYLWKQRTLFWK